MEFSHEPSPTIFCSCTIYCRGACFWEFDLRGIMLLNKLREVLLHFHLRWRCWVWKTEVHLFLTCCSSSHRDEDSGMSLIFLELVAKCLLFLSFCCIHHRQPQFIGLESLSCMTKNTRLCKTLTKATSVFLKHHEEVLENNLLNFNWETRLCLFASWLGLKGESSYFNIYVYIF